VTATLKNIVENLSSEPSKPPYDLRYNWTPTNDLELRWKHPNETNGDIMLFHVTLLPNFQTSLIIRNSISQQTELHVGLLSQSEY
jgi:hypothetical protein